MTAAESFPSEWTPEVAQRLAQPFAAEQVGKLPRGGNDVARDKWTYCNDCKQKAAPRHFHVDYINHAVVTDRLNSVVGPHNWSWSLLTVERDQGGRLLAVVGEMTVLGHTKGPETGTPPATQKDYGEALKGAFSDYLCRAAMRFGVALDLWAKQQLESAAETKTTAAPQESEPGGASTLQTQAVDSTVADPAKAPDPHLGPVADGTPPGSDTIPRFGGPGAARAWLRAQPEEFRTAVGRTASEHGVDDLSKASLDDLNTLIEVAWKTHQAA